jgi:hypothetical protein
VQGVDDLEADQAGAQAEGAQQLADLFVAGAFVSKTSCPLGALPGRAQPDRGLRVVHVNAPFRGRTRNVVASLTRTNENAKTAATVKKSVFFKTFAACARKIFIWPFV